MIEAHAQTEWHHMHEFDYGMAHSNSDPLKSLQNLKVFLKEYWKLLKAPFPKNRKNT